MMSAQKLLALPALFPKETKGMGSLEAFMHTKILLSYSGKKDVS